MQHQPNRRAIRRRPIATKQQPGNLTLRLRKQNYPSFGDGTGVRHESVKVERRQPTSMTENRHGAASPAHPQSSKANTAPQQQVPIKGSNKHLFLQFSILFQNTLRFIQM
ncbi:hypothetical protein, unlikely [Trypanosoma brucei gambiense DAL972]|uniref:Uncharacterized protein n=1 Tax=Trypanosoma brucei gambiense (strain MHOM/CI/86/DAL972) TaxID=679716 RepID=D0A3I4_TRYB9|nr:hypothetical protein, unlikely [Trypanosoma brucei gambiense DAL972]CBH15828.1 hypothetical protein, unlikely [Trypanosoma brucei gambiense DAL972]|eukprot:XP_011778092.1 hypothetical protein, unlikely [Trypanosoma brucei gambiense DAL972]